REDPGADDPRRRRRKPDREGHQRPRGEAELRWRIDRSLLSRSSETARPSGRLLHSHIAAPHVSTSPRLRGEVGALLRAACKGLSISKGTRGAQECADRYGKPLLVFDVSRPDAAAQVAEWLGALRRRFGEHMTLGVGGPRESEAPGIYASARPILAAVLRNDA